MPQAPRQRAERSDAVRNRDAILEAAATCLVANPNASLADIAEAAGIGRVTLYGHFSSRTELLEALLRRSMERVEVELGGVDLSGSTWHAMDTLVRSSWRLLADLSALRGVVEQGLPEADMHASHGDPRARVDHLLARGRADGSFRTDQPLSWQSACYFSILHGAAAEIRLGTLSEPDAEALIPLTLRALLQASPE